MTSSVCPLPEDPGPCPQGWRRGAYSLVAVFSRTEVLYWALDSYWEEAHFPKSCMGVWPSNCSPGWGLFALPPGKPSPLPSHLSFRLTLQPPKMYDHLPSTQPFGPSESPPLCVMSSPRGPAACPVLLLFQVVLLPAQISILLPPGWKRPPPSPTIPRFRLLK